MRQIWNIWSQNRQQAGGEFVIHAIEEDCNGHLSCQTVCGKYPSEEWESGLLRIPQQTMPSCIKCHEITNKKLPRQPIKKVKGEG